MGKKRSKRLPSRSCTTCGKRCTRVGESESTIGDPPSPDHLVYKCPDGHGYQVYNAKDNTLYGESGRPSSDFERIKNRMGIKWKRLNQ